MIHKSLGVVMDPIQSIWYEKDTTLALLWEAQKRGYVIHYFELNDLWIRDGKAYGNSRRLTVQQNPHQWFTFAESTPIPLDDLSVILMRKDPPFDLEYLYATYILECAEREGVLVLNKPQSLRDANEKLFALQFAECTPKTLVTRDITQLNDFIKEYHEIVLKPLHAMGGRSVFRVSINDPNIAVILSMMTANETQTILAQPFIPDIKNGDKRILLIEGQPVPFALARIPSANDWRGNMSVGAIGVAQPLTTRDQWICDTVGPTLRQKGLFFVGIDVIGDFLTEINVTSPTGIRELDAQCGLNISHDVFDRLESLRMTG